MRRLLALILAAIAAFLVAPQAAVTATSVTSVSVYTYDGHHHSAPSVGGTSERGPPAAGNHFANDNAVDRRSYGDSARPDIGESPAACTYTYTDPAPSVQVTPTTWHRAEVADGQLIAFARGRVAANAPARGWTVGQPIDNLTKAGNSPAWSTVRARYWKNRANSALDGEFSPAQLERMAAGKPPPHPTVGVSMELDHIVPRHLGGTHAPGNLREVWPWRHAELDPYRYYNGPTP